MSLFPFATNTGVQESTPTSASTIREYEIDFNTGRLTGRIVEGVDALVIWAYLAVKARRYRWEIYSWYYGSELRKLIGNSYSEEYLKSEVQRYLEECLVENENITGVKNVEVTQVKDKLTIKFTLVTVVGSKEVQMDV
jgi:hypothetical protein